MVTTEETAGKYMQRKCKKHLSVLLQKKSNEHEEVK